MWMYATVTVTAANEDIRDTMDEAEAENIYSDSTMPPACISRRGVTEEVLSIADIGICQLDKLLSQV